jgi:hypothetical protein
MTHTFTTGTADSAVMGTGEEIPHLQSMVVHWGKGLAVCTLLDLQLMTHVTTAPSTWCHTNTTNRTLQFDQALLILHMTEPTHHAPSQTGTTLWKMCCLRLQDRRKLLSPFLKGLKMFSSSQTIECLLTVRPLQYIFVFKSVAQASSETPARIMNVMPALTANSNRMSWQASTMIARTNWSE